MSNPPGSAPTRQLAESEDRIDRLFSEAFGTNSEPMLDYVAVKFEMKRLRHAIADLQKENTELRTAMSNHLCEHDMADWLGCRGGHEPRCEVCDDADNGITHHALRAEVSRLRAALAALPQEPRT